MKAIEKSYIVLALLSLGFLVQSCGNLNTNPSGTAVIQGKVVQKGNLAPIKDALVRSLSFVETVLTDSEGKFSFSVELPDTNARIITLIVSKEGFVSDTLFSVIIQNDKVVTAPDAVLTNQSGSTGNSGPASNIVLVDLETSNIFVRSSGANETSDLTFEVRDDQGRPIDLAHQVKVCFSITGGPGGGEFLAPDSVVTNQVGRVVTTVNSGTIAGALQVVAEIQGKAIFSAPVPIAIHGWLPDLNHFSVVPNKLNFAGFNIFGLQNKITAFVGDKFSNPVPPGTAVQFQSTGGIIEGSAVTDELGRSSVDLLSAAPQPPGIPGAASPLDEPGFALITAQTVDENQQNISTTTVVLFSGVTQLSVSPTSFALQPFASQLFNYTVSDQNQNPLVEGTNISVTTNNGDVSGATNFTLADTQSRAFTHFSFVLTNSTPDSTRAKSATVTIAVTSQNGNVTSLVTGTMLPIQ
ncbi:MAG: hypothetical protein ACE5HO_17305 [bacterium]